MPLYEYQCAQCGEIEETIQKFSDPPLTSCRHCTGKLNKMISQSSFHLKGTGWYVTDYSKKSKPETNSKDSEPKTSTGEKCITGGSKPKAAKSDV